MTDFFCFINVYFGNKDVLSQFVHFLRLIYVLSSKKNSHTIFLSAMEFGYANNERKIQRVDLETGIIYYGRRKPSGISYPSSFQ